MKPWSWLLPGLTIILAADPVAHAGADHVLAAPVFEPALSVAVGRSGVRSARPSSGGLELLARLRGGHHDGPRVCGEE